MLTASSFQLSVQQTLLELKKNISVTSKKNFTLERDIRTLDKKIALLIRNKITIEVCSRCCGRPGEKR